MRRTGFDCRRPRTRETMNRTIPLVAALLLALAVMPVPAQAGPVDQHALDTVEDAALEAEGSATDALPFTAKTATLNTCAVDALQRTHHDGGESPFIRWMSPAFEVSRIEAQCQDEEPECEDHSDYCEQTCYGGPPASDYCSERIYCQTHPDAHPCTGATEPCEDGFYGWDTDRDGVCDNDDEDDDNDGVPDYCDNTHNQVDNQIQYLLWTFAQYCYGDSIP